MPRNVYQFPPVPREVRGPVGLIFFAAIAVIVAALALILYTAITGSGSNYMVRAHCADAYNPEACVEMLSPNSTPKGGAQ